MRISLIAILSHIHIKEDFKRIKYSGLNLEKDLTLVSSFRDNTIQEIIGVLSYNELRDNPGFYLNKPFVESDSQLDSSGLEMLSFRGIIQQFLTAMWINTDNAINANTILSKTSKNYISKNYSPKMFSNSQGEYRTKIFSRKDIENSIEWFNKLLEIQTTINPNGLSFDREEDYETSNRAHINSDKYINYKDYNRLQRFLRFIILARSESFIHAKITFYISALETLLTTSEIELRMQVADRTSRILGEDFDQRIKINKIVSIAYAFRSAYIHGSVKSDRSSSRTLQNFNNVEELSNELDEILRQLTKKFLTELRHVAEMNNEDFAKWMNRLLYE